VDIHPILALVTSFGLILLGNAMEGGHLSSLIQPTAGLIVFGGTLGAVWLGSPPSELKTVGRQLPTLLKPKVADRVRLREDILKVTTVVRRDGMLAVENILPTIGDERLRRGLQMLVDGNSGEDVRRVLELDAEVHEHHELAAAKLWTDAGAYAPTVGILGAVLGLIHVMSNLSVQARSRHRRGIRGHGVRGRLRQSHLPAARLPLQEARAAGLRGPPDDHGGHLRDRGRLQQPPALRDDGTLPAPRT
jgi:chemotaxis protein MotA